MATETIKIQYVNGVPQFPEGFEGLSYSADPTADPDGEFDIAVYADQETIDALVVALGAV